MNVRTREPKILFLATGVSHEALRWDFVPPMGYPFRTTNTDYTAEEAPERTRFAVSGGGATFTASEGI